MQSVPLGGAFDEASRAVTAYLSDAIPLGFWSVTRYDGARQVYLTVDGDAPPMAVGDSRPWEQTFCQHVVAGEAPHVSPDASAVPVYAAHGYADVGAYVGVPIRHADGTVFGTLCGSDPSTRDHAFAAHGPLLELLTGLLGQVLESDLERASSKRDAELALALAETDVLTGLLNRRGWDRMLALQDERSRTFGDPAVLIAIDLDGLKSVNDTQGHDAGDDLIRRAADVLRSVLRPDDTVARLGGDEFGVLVPLTPDAGEHFVARLVVAFAEAEVAASLGSAEVTVIAGCTKAWKDADKRMYVMKKRRRLTLVS